MDKHEWVIWLTILQSLDTIESNEDVSAFEAEVSGLLKKFKKRKKQTNVAN